MQPATASRACPAPEPAPASTRRCVLDATGGLSAAAVFGAAAACTARSRNLSPLQASACQPLGAWHCALGFQHCRPQLEDADACLRHFARFRADQGLDPTAFGTADRVVDPAGAPAPLPEAAAPSERAPSADAAGAARFRTCLGRDRAATADAPPLARADTPSFVGNQSHGWDAMFTALIETLGPAVRPIAQDASVNLVLGFEHFAANYRILLHLLQGFGLRVRLLGDATAMLEQPRLGASNPRGTPLAELRAAPGARDTLLARPWQLPKAAARLRQRWGHPVRALPIPMGLAWTDAWLNYLAQLSGNEVPARLQLQRYQLCEAIHRALPRLCRQRFAVYGEPDFVMGTSRYLIELGAGPALILCQNGDRRWLEAMRGLLQDCGHADDVAIHIGGDSGALQPLLHRHRPDLLIAPPALCPSDQSSLVAGTATRRVALERASGSGDQPSTLGYAGARHLLHAILAALMERA